MRSVPQKSRHIHSLTGMRAFLIAWIVLYHLKEDIDQLFPQQEWLSDFAAAGFIGVDFFFLASGFVIAYNYAVRFKQFNAQIYGRFLWMRLARIYPVHLFSLLLYFLLIMAMTAAGIQPNNPELYTASGFIQNIFLVQAWTLPTTFSWNSVAWAVSNEWFAYLCFPLVIAITLRLRHWTATLVSVFVVLWAMAATCLLLNAGWTVPYGAGSYGLLRIAGEFVAGCLIYNLYVAAWGSRWQWGAITSIVWVISIGGGVLLNGAKGVGALSVLQMSGQLNVLWLTPLFAFAVYALAWEKGFLARLFSTRLMRYGGHISYALYLTHFLCLILLRRAFPISIAAAAHPASKLALILGYLTIMLAVATLTYRFVEEPGRNWMKRLTEREDSAVRTAAIASPSDLSSKTTKETSVRAQIQQSVREIVERPRRR